MVSLINREEKIEESLRTPTYLRYKLGTQKHLSIDYQVFKATFLIEIFHCFTALGG